MNECKQHINWFPVKLRPQILHEQCCKILMALSYLTQTIGRHGSRISYYWGRGPRHFFGGNKKSQL